MTLEFPERAGEAGRVWDRIAHWWDDRIGDGNATQDLLVEPVQERLLALAPGEVVLDVACGAGRFTRRMAAKGARVVAFDRCEPFLERARQKTTSDAIEYHRIDATDRDKMLALGRHRFDAAVATMALMDIVRLDPLLEALPELLKPEGRFVFSVSHPSFNSGDARPGPDGSVSVTDYLTPRATLRSRVQRGGGSARTSHERPTSKRHRDAGGKVPRPLGCSGKNASRRTPFISGTGGQLARCFEAGKRALSSGGAPAKRPARRCPARTCGSGQCRSGRCAAPRGSHRVRTSPIGLKESLLAYGPAIRRRLGVNRPARWSYRRTHGTGRAIE